MIDIETIKGELDRTQLLLQDERAAREVIEQRLTVVDTQLQQQQQVILGAPQVQNLIRNGDLSHSWDTFMRAAPVADDARFECYTIYRHAVPAAAQQLKEDSIYSGVLVANSTALPDAGRSDTPNVDPDWDRSKGFARLGSTSTIDFPLLGLPCFPGRTLYCGVIAAKRSANVTIPGGLYAGIWDNTAGQRDWLPAGAFAITASVIGTPGATTSRDYLVVARTDWGRTISSAAVTVAGAPSNGSFVSGSVYVKLSWTPIPGVVGYDIYRKTGAVYDLLASESVANGYFDQGAIRTAGISGYPSTSGTNAIAYVAIADGLLDSLPINGVSPSWQLIDFAINIPATYNLGNTTDKQWLRIGWTQALTGADAAHGVYLDLAYLSYISGAWAHHPDDDKGLQNPISSPNGSSQGGTGSGGGGFEPPDPGEGGTRCIAEESRVLAAVKSRTAVELEPGQCLLSPERERWHVAPIRSVERTWAEDRLRVVAESGHEIICSATEPFKQYLYDRHGVAASTLEVGDPVVVSDGRREYVSKITITEKAEPGWVVMVSLAGRRKFFVAATQESPEGGYVLHNEKAL